MKELRRPRLLGAMSACWAVALLAACGATSVPRLSTPGTSQPGASSKPATAADLADLPVGPDRQRILEDGARREGQLMMYTTSTGLEPAMAAFTKKYPFVKADIFVSRGDPLTQRTLNEAKAGRLGADILRIDFAIYPDLKDLFIKFDSPGAKYEAAPNVAQLDYTGIGFTYSTARVAAVDVPRKVEDLLKPRWAHSLGFFAPPNNYPGRWVGALIDQMGDQAARDFLTKLGDQKPSFYTQPQAAKTGLLAGEWDLNMQGITTGVQSVRSGEPIGWTALDPTTLSPTIIGLPRLAPHPYAAMLFLDWAVSAEGQQTFSGIEGSISQQELDAREKDGVPLPQRIHIQTPDEAGKLDGWMKLFDQLVAKK